MKNLKIVIPVVIAVTALIAAIVIAISPSRADRVSSNATDIDTAYRYLNNNELDRAIAIFNDIIRIDPKNVDAYSGLAQAYEGKGDIDKAIETLEEGYAQTSDSRILDMLDRLRKDFTSDSTDTNIFDDTQIITKVTTVSSKTVDNTIKDILSDNSQSADTGDYDKNGWLILRYDDIRDFRAMKYYFEDPDHFYGSVTKDGNGALAQIVYCRTRDFVNEYSIPSCVQIIFYDSTGKKYHVECFDENRNPIGGFKKENGEFTEIKEYIYNDNVKEYCIYKIPYANVCTEEFYDSNGNLNKHIHYSAMGCEITYYDSNGERIDQQREHGDYSDDSRQPQMSYIGTEKFFYDYPFLVDYWEGI